CRNAPSRPPAARASIAIVEAPLRFLPPAKPGLHVESVVHAESAREHSTHPCAFAPLAVLLDDERTAELGDPGLAKRLKGHLFGALETGRIRLGLSENTEREDEALARLEEPQREGHPLGLRVGLRPEQPVEDAPRDLRSLRIGLAVGLRHREARQRARGDDAHDLARVVEPRREDLASLRVTEGEETFDRELLEVAVLRRDVLEEIADLASGLFGETTLLLRGRHPLAFELHEPELAVLLAELGFEHPAVLEHDVAERGSSDLVVRIEPKNALRDAAQLRAKPLLARPERQAKERVSIALVRLAPSTI